MESFARRHPPLRDAKRRAAVLASRKIAVGFESPREAEKAAWSHLISLGVKDAELTGPGADGGIDVIARSVVAQVKDHRIPVGRPVVQQTLGVATSLDRRAAVYATSGFTAAAVHFADDTKVALFRLHVDKSVTPCSQVACQLVGQRASAGAWSPAIRSAAQHKVRLSDAERLAVGQRRGIHLAQRKAVLFTFAALICAGAIGLIRYLP